ncbi:MAG TPA: HAD-IIA family hydrolase [Nocardioides sp.]|nr:HAD-IIA family hydrolase [Nocardioides sp.]
MLRSSDRPLVDVYDLGMFDLDGVVYVGEEAVPGAAPALARARESGWPVAFVTNNASRTPQAVVDKLEGVGVRAGAEDVVTSAQAAAHLLRETHGDGAAIACLGSEGLVEALREVGLRAVAVDDDAAVGIVSGYAPEAVWRDIMHTAVLVRDGLPWVASNRDLTLPTPWGTAPGHGVLVGLIEEFAGVTPRVAGKPEPPLLEETIRRVGGDHPLMVGDRLDTDIEGAANVDVDSLLVMTGVTDLAELVAAEGALRPTYVASDLAGLFEPHPAPEQEAEDWSCGGWTASAAGGSLTVSGSGSDSDWWRAVAAAAWRHLDESGRPVDTGDAVPPGGRHAR